MEQAVIILSDLYPGPGDGAVGPKLDGLRRLLRFGRHAPLPAGWRDFLARWLRRADLAAAAPAALAQAAQPVPASGYDQLWLVQPVHLVAGLASVYLGRQGLLRLDAPEREQLCDGFNHTFADSGYRLLPQPGGLVLCGPTPPAELITVEPARRLGTGVDAVLTGAGSAGLRRLCSEVEMWLFEQPLNRQRERAGLPPVSALWPWGGGAPLPADAGVATAADAAVLAGDAAACGLAVLAGADCRASARTAADVLGCGAARVCAVLELFRLPGAAAATLPECLEAFDRTFVVPLLGALRAGRLGRLELIASDRCIALRPRDRWRLWRRACDPLHSLAAEHSA